MIVSIRYQRGDTRYTPLPFTRGDNLDFLGEKQRCQPFQALGGGGLAFDEAHVARCLSTRFEASMDVTYIAVAFAYGAPSRFPRAPRGV